MNPLPAQDLRSNLGTWAVPPRLTPAVVGLMREALPPEPYDPEFYGQELETTYFDTRDFDLRKARRRGGKYLTLRLRRYRPNDIYAVSAKTENGKFRIEIEPEQGEAILDGGTGALAELLPADLFARLLSLGAEEFLIPVVTVLARRYAVENDADRLTLDTAVRTDSGKILPADVLEFKSAVGPAGPPSELSSLRLRPVKISKFLWATLWR
jgi:hypothetical protein